MPEAVAFMLIRDGKVMVERRRRDKAKDPGILAIPGGHLEPGETPEDALRREAKEETTIELGAPRFVCTLLHPCPHLLKLHYYAVTDWRGEIEALEAESLHWLALDDVAQLDLPVCRTAVREYQRLYES